MNKNIAVEPLGDDLLHEFTYALKETDWLVHLGEAIVGAAGLVEDDDGALVPGMGARFEGRIEDVGEGVRPGGVGPCEDAVANPARAQCCVVHHGFEGGGDLACGDGRPIAGGPGWGVGVLNRVHRDGGGQEEAGLEDVGLKGQVVDQGAVGGLEGWKSLDLSSVAGLCQTPDVAVFDGVVEAVIPLVFGLAEGAVKAAHCLHAAGVGGGKACCGVCKVALGVPPC